MSQASLVKQIPENVPSVPDFPRFPTYWFTIEVIAVPLPNRSSGAQLRLDVQLVSGFFVVAGNWQGNAD